MNAHPKMRSPHIGSAEAGKKDGQTAFFYPAVPIFVKQNSHILTCGQCSLFKEGRRKFCAFLGDRVRASDACKVDSLSPEFEAWICDC